MDVPVRTQYAAALNRSVSFGVVSYSNGQCELTETEPGLCPFSAHLLYPQNRKWRAADCGRRFRFSSGATIGRVDTTSRGNSKSLVKLLCAYALPVDPRARTVRDPIRNPRRSEG